MYIFSTYILHFLKNILMKFDIFKFLLSDYFYQLFYLIYAILLLSKHIRIILSKFLIKK